MGGVTSGLPHLSEFEVSIRLKQTTGREHRRWLVIWNALVDPRPALEIALHTGVSFAIGNSVVSRYNRFGLEAIRGHEQGIRRRCYLRKEAEAEFVTPFLEVAPTEQLCVAGPIKDALEQLFIQPVHHSTAYRILHRNGWREIGPRPGSCRSQEGNARSLEKRFREVGAEIV